MTRGKILKMYKRLYWYYIYLSISEWAHILGITHRGYCGENWGDVHGRCWVTNHVHIHCPCIILPADCTTASRSSASSSCYPPPCCCSPTSGSTGSSPPSPSGGRSGVLCSEDIRVNMSACRLKLSRKLFFQSIIPKYFATIWQILEANFVL